MSIRYIDSCYKIIVEGTFAAEGTDINNSKFSVDPLKGGVNSTARSVCK